MTGVRLVRAVSRIAAATSIIRTRAEDAARLERVGGSEELAERLEATVAKLEQLAGELEALIA